MDHDAYIDTCDGIRDVLLDSIANVEQLKKRLTNIGHQGFIVWIREHIDEVVVLINSPRRIDIVQDSPRRDMLLYSASSVCNLARGLIESAGNLGISLSGEPPEVVSSMGTKMLSLCHRKIASWPWEEPHPFSLDARK